MVWVLAAAVAAVVGVGALTWKVMRARGVDTGRHTPAEEELEAAEHSRPLANVTVLRGGDGGDFSVRRDHHHTP